MQCPKKPLSGFWFWLNDVREEIAKEFGTSKGSSVSKIAGGRWKLLGSHKKQPYEKKAEVAKKKYDIAMGKFKASGGVLRKRKHKSGKHGARVKKIKNFNASHKDVAGAFGQYLNENRAAIANSLPEGSNPITDVAKKAGEQWKILPKKEKAKYDSLYRTKVEEYKLAMEKYASAVAGNGRGSEEDNHGMV